MLHDATFLCTMRIMRSQFVNSWYNSSTPLYNRNTVVVQHVPDFL